MEKESSTYGLEPDKLRALLDVCSDTDQVKDQSDPEQEKSELLQDRLTESLPIEHAQKSLSKTAARHLCGVAGVIVGEPIRDLLSDMGTDIALINRIKNYGKKVSEHANSLAAHDTANAIYYAAIAHALVFHGRKISKFSYKDLEHAFEVFSKKNWIPANLVNLFQKAGQCCCRKRK